MPRKHKGERVNLELRVRPATKTAWKEYAQKHGLDGISDAFEEIGQKISQQESDSEGILAAFHAAKAENDSLRSLVSDLQAALRKRAKRGQAKVIASRPANVLPEWVFDLAMRTPCANGDGMMDPVGLHGGHRVCADCRRKV